MRVLLVTDWNRGRGGAEAHITWLRDGLRAAGDDVRLLTSSAGTAGDGTADYVGLGTDRRLAQAVLQIVNPIAVVAARRAVHDFSPDVVLVNMFAHHLSPAILRPLARLPVVLLVSDYKCVCPIGSKLLPDGTLCTARAGWVCHRAGCVGLLHWVRDRPRYALIRTGVRRVARVLACSRYLAAELGRDGIAAETIIYPVPAPTTGAGTPNADPTFVFCGRLEREKGVDVLLAAFARVRGEVPTARLRIVGDGSERDRLEQRARTLGLAAAVSFNGWLDPPAVERQLADAWALVAPSLWAEPLGLVALEAMVRGVPVLASAVGGLSETVEDGATGLLVPNGDALALGDRMIALARGDLFPSHRLPAQLVARVTERHSVKRHVDAMRTVFGELKLTWPTHLAGAPPRYRRG